MMRAKGLASAWTDLINCREQVVYGLLGSEGGGVDGDAGEMDVEGMAAGEAVLRGFGIVEDGALNILEDAPVE